MAAKLRAAAALASARATGSQTERAKAVALLEQAADQWEEVIRITKAHLEPVPLMHLLTPLKEVAPNSSPKFSWENYRKDFAVVRAFLGTASSASSSQVLT